MAGGARRGANKTLTFVESETVSAADVEGSMTWRELT